MARRAIFLLLILVWTEGNVSVAVELDLRGEAAVALTVSDVAPRSLNADFRYLPEFLATVPVSRTREFTTLAAIDATWRNQIVSFSDATSDGDVDAYRLWARYGASRVEVRLGLQKLSFGSATLLRPLMWFDSIDPRDPLQITDGVTGLLLRTYFLNNANVWLWGLYGNDDPKGWELVPTEKDAPELGGRLQWPAGNGEIAFSYHHRRADLSSLVPPAPPPRPDAEAPEDRFALDGKWDVTVGVWFEAVLVHQQNDLLDRPYRRLASAGVDYTFGVGQGLTALAEHLILGASDEPLGAADHANTSAFSLRYPWGVVDEFNLILYYDWDSEELSSFLEWRRRYDRWAVHLIGFASPDDATLSVTAAGNDFFAGRGLRALIVFNH